MNWIDDLVTAGITAVVGGVIGWRAAISGARIGANATREASIGAFDRQREEEHNRWRVALWHECCQNIQFDSQRSPVELWSYETSILRDASQHASAFTATVLQRIIWARTVSEELEHMIEQISTERRAFATSQGSTREDDKVRETRTRFIGEIDEIEKALRNFAPKET